MERQVVHLPPYGDPATHLPYFGSVGNMLAPHPMAEITGGRPTSNSSGGIGREKVEDLHEPCNAC